MQDILSNLRSTVIAGFVLTLILFIIGATLLGGSFAVDYAWTAFLIRWLHVISGVMWIGLLWYFNCEASGRAWLSMRDGKRR